MKTLIVDRAPEPFPDKHFPDPHQDTFSKTVIGFWVYLMSDCVLFGTLFATYAVLHNNTFGGPSSRDLFSLETSFGETMILLFSSVACGLGMLASVRNQKNHVLAWFILAFVLGASFIALELHEFSQLVQDGHSWKRSAFL